MKMLKNLLRFAVAPISLLFLYGLVFAQTQTELTSTIQYFGTAYNANATVPKKTFASALKKAKVFKALTKKAFLPNNKVTFEFALKTLCKAGNWTPKKTLTACNAYAKSHGFLAAPIPEPIKLKSKVTFENLAYLMSRAAAAAAAAPTAEPAKETAIESAAAIPDAPPEKQISVSVTPFREQTFGTTFFSNITLSRSLPSHFYDNEVYFIEGDVATEASRSEPADEVFIFLCKDGQECDNSINFLGDIKHGHFKIPVHFNAGNYQLGIIPGRSGQSRVVDISVIPGPGFTPNDGNAATSLSTAYQEGETKFSWNGEGSVTRLTIYQGQERMDYLFRQRINSFVPPSKDFAQFKKGAAYWFVQQNNSKSQVKEMQLTVQDFRKIDDEEVEIKNLKETFDAPGHFAFRGHALGPVSKRAAITLPNGRVRELVFSASDIAAGKDINIETELETAGTYHFEVNNPEGAAVVNVPIYVGNEIPLLPDYFALHQTEPIPGAVGNLDIARKKLLDLINADRKAHDLQGVAISNKLNTVAQAHSENMVRLDFFAHVDPTGKSPDDRRKAASYPASIRENLGKASTLELVEAGLMRSPIHRETILDPEMTLVGLGIAKKSDGYYIVTQNFSSTPLAAEDLSALENELFAKALAVRGSNGLSALEHDATLRSVAAEWSSRMARNGFFAVTDQSGNALLENARDRGVRSAIQAHIIEVSTKKQLEEELLSQPGMTNASNSKIGIGLGINAFGDLFMTVLYTP